MEIFVKHCIICNKILKAKPCHIRSGRAKFCSRECRTEAQRGNKLSPEARKKFVEAGYRAWCGRKHKPETRKLFSDIQLGKFKEEARGWRGGKIIVHGGYIKVLSDEKYFDKLGHQKNKYVFEHRYMMEKHLGRKLSPNEIIHHRNGIKDDNRLENLEIVLRKSHRGRVSCPHCLKEFFIK